MLSCIRFNNAKRFVFLKPCTLHAKHHPKYFLCGSYHVLYMYNLLNSVDPIDELNKQRQMRYTAQECRSVLCTVLGFLTLIWNTIWCSKANTICCAWFWNASWQIRSPCWAPFLCLILHYRWLPKYRRKSAAGGVKHHVGIARVQVLAITQLDWLPRHRDSLRIQFSPNNALLMLLVSHLDMSAAMGLATRRNTLFGVRVAAHCAAASQTVTLSTIPPDFKRHFEFSRQETPMKQAIREGVISKPRHTCYSTHASSNRNL